MPRGSLNTVIRNLRSVLIARDADQLSDGELLRRFIDQRDEAAFAIVVRRHGAMVLQVCRRILHCAANAEDAFQAAFLLLAKKGPSVCHEPTLAGWLHEVACHCAWDLRKSAMRRQKRESVIRNAPQSESPLASAATDELRAILDEEIQRLSAKRRAAIVLCVLEGKSRTEAAQTLGCTEGTLASRLARGRATLQKRLVARGVALPAALATIANPPTSLSAGVSTSLTSRTVDVALAFVAGGGVMAPTHLVAVANGVLASMILTKLKVGAVLLLTASLTVVAAGFASQEFGGQLATGNHPPAVQAQKGPLDSQVEISIPRDASQKGLKVEALTKLPDGAVTVFGRAPFDNGSYITASEMSPDGQFIATLSRRSATVWDTATAQPMFRAFFDIPVLFDVEGRLAFSRNGRWLACGPASNLISVLDVATGKEVRRFTGDFESAGSALFRFSEDATSLLVGTDSGIARLNIATGEIVQRRLSHGAIRQLSPDEKTFVVVKERGMVPESPQRQLLIGDALTGDLKHTLAIDGLLSKSDQSVLFLPDGNLLAVVVFEGVSTHELRFWDLATGKRLDKTWALAKSDGHERYRMTLSADGKVLFIPEQRRNIRRYLLDIGKELPPIELIGDYYLSGIFPHPDGRTLFAVGSRTIRRWDTQSGKELSSNNFINWHETALSLDGRWLARRAYQDRAGESELLELCETASAQSKKIALSRSERSRFAFAADSRALAVHQDSRLKFFSVPGLKETKSFAIPDRTSTLAFSNDGNLVATCGRQLRIFDLRTHKEIWSLDSPYSDTKAIFAPNSKQILVEPFRRNELTLHDFKDEKTAFQVMRPLDRHDGKLIHTGFPIIAWSFTPDGRHVVAAMSGGDMVVLDAETGNERHRFPAIATNESRVMRHLPCISAMAFSLDGQWFATGGEDGFLRIWDAKIWRELHRLHGHDNHIRSIVFSADGPRLVSYADAEGFVWDLRPLQKQGGDAFAKLLADDPPTVYRAIWALADDPRGASVVRENIAPRHVDARPERIVQLIADLGAENFKTRDTAMKSLTDLEGAAHPALRETLTKSPNLETRRRIAALLDDPMPAQVLRQMRAVKAMELSGSAAAQKALEEWASGSPGLRLTDAAQAAHARLRTKAADIDKR